MWSAKVAGRPIRPGVAERDAVLLPLEKGRAGEEAPTFVVELVYLHRAGVGSVTIDAFAEPGRFVHESSFRHAAARRHAAASWRALRTIVELVGAGARETAGSGAPS